MSIVYWQSGIVVRARKRDSLLLGNGSYLGDRVDGVLDQIGVVSAHAESGRPTAGGGYGRCRCASRTCTMHSAQPPLHADGDTLRGRCGRDCLVFPPAEAIGYVSALAGR